MTENYSRDRFRTLHHFYQACFSNIRVRFLSPYSSRPPASRPQWVSTSRSPGRRRGLASVEAGQAADLGISKPVSRHLLGYSRYHHRKNPSCDASVYKLCSGLLGRELLGHRSRASGPSLFLQAVPRRPDESLQGLALRASAAIASACKWIVILVGTFSRDSECMHRCVLAGLGPDSGSESGLPQ